MITILVFHITKKCPLYNIYVRAKFPAHPVLVDWWNLNSSFIPGVLSGNVINAGIIPFTSFLALAFFNEELGEVEAVRTKHQGTIVGWKR